MAIDIAAWPEGKAYPVGSYIMLSGRDLPTLVLSQENKKRFPIKTQIENSSMLHSRLTERYMTISMKKMGTAIAPESLVNTNTTAFKLSDQNLENMARDVSSKDLTEYTVEASHNNRLNIKLEHMRMIMLIFIK